MLTDAQWTRTELLLPPLKGPMGKPFLPHRPVIEGCIYRLKGGIPWRMLPREYGAWQTVHRRHQRWSQDGTWDRIPAELQAQAETAGEIDWQISVDSTISRVHQHGAAAARCSSGPSSHTWGGWNHKDQPLREDETDGHGIGRSRGGLTSKTHALVDGKGRLLVCIISPGQAGDSPVLPLLLAELRVNSHLAPAGRAPRLCRCAATRRTPPAATGHCSAAGGSRR
ncbi:MAG: family transposase [Frankiales bacterium]|jgi:transposase|nr:family transposase [Frankiales bacterium]